MNEIQQKKCFVCGHMEKKEPDVRSFICIECGTEMLRIANSSVNIGKKVGYLLDIREYKHKLRTFMITGEASFGKPVSWLKNKL